jgi:aryl-alcohol dehydrogenase-like predicted oxidoreductase
MSSEMLGRVVSADKGRIVGFGCMGMSAFYASAEAVPEEQKVRVFREAVRRGVTLFNSATFYGPLTAEGYGSNLRLIRKCMEGVDRASVQLMVKVGMDTRSGTFVCRASESEIMEDINYALSQLGTDYIDIVVLCRVSPSVPIEDSMRGLRAAVEQGKARAAGLSEASAATIRRAHAVFPVSYVEQEWSMYARDIEEDILPTCDELGVTVVAYSPLGRGFLAGAIPSRDSIGQGDFRLHLPKFAEENFDVNKRVVEFVTSFASRKGITPGQLALAWLLAKNKSVIPIPGTTIESHLIENIAAYDVALSPEELASIDAELSLLPVRGERYAHMQMTSRGN